MFFKCNTEEECLKLFRKLALKLHPDQGGSNELMILLQESFEEKTKFIELMEQCKAENEKKNVYENVYEKIKFTDERIKIIHEIIEYFKEKKQKSDFINSVNEFLQERGYVTSGQYNSLVKIYYQFEIHKRQE